VVHLSSCKPGDGDARRELNAASAPDLQQRNEPFHQVSDARGCPPNGSGLSRGATLRAGVPLLRLLRRAQLGQGCLALYAHDVAQRPHDAHARAGVERVDSDTAEQRRAPAARVTALQQLAQLKRASRDLPAATWQSAAAAVDSSVSPLRIMLQLRRRATAARQRSSSSSLICSGREGGR
jgi:hypothetical protein